MFALAHTPSIKFSTEAKEAGENGPYDSTIVDWEGPSDPSNPLNWPGRYKWVNILLTSLQGTLTNYIHHSNVRDLLPALRLLPHRCLHANSSHRSLRAGDGNRPCTRDSLLRDLRPSSGLYVEFLHLRGLGCWLLLNRPVRLLFTSPICTFMSKLSLIYGILYLHLITLTLLFGPSQEYGLFSYRWTHGTTSLAYQGAGTGSLIGIIICATFLDRSYAYTARLHGKRTGQTGHMPEYRMPFLQAGMIIIPMGLAIFGWSAKKQAHWIIPLIGSCVFGSGMLMSYICIQTYLVDAFDQFAASALAAAVVTRGSMLLAFLCIDMIPLSIVLWNYGPRLRARQAQL